MKTQGTRREPEIDISDMSIFSVSHPSILVPNVDSYIHTATKKTQELGSMGAITYNSYHFFTKGNQPMVYVY